MNRLRSLVSVACLIALWSPAAFAQRQAVIGPGPTALNATGSLNGVDMSLSGGTGTLTVGVVGGPQTDVFSSNGALASPLPAITTDAASTANVVINSSSNVFGAVGTPGNFFLNVSGGNTGTTVNFLGPVFSTITTVSGTGTLNFNSGNTNVTATNFAGDGVIGLAPNTTVIGALTTTAGAQTGTLNLASASTLNGAVGGAVGLRSINVVGNNVTATITGATNSFAFGLGTNTLNIGGALTIANGGTGGVINTTLASPTVFGNIRPVGATNLGPSVLVNVTVNPGAIIPVGTQFNIVQTRAGTVQSGTNGTIVNIAVQSPTNPLYTFSAVPPAGTVAGLVAIVVTGIPVLVPIAPPPNVVVPPLPVLPIAVTVVPALLVTPVTPDVSAVLTAINLLQDPSGVINAVAQLAPSVPDLAAPLVTFQGTRQFQNLWLSRLDDLMCDQVNQLKEDQSQCPKNDPKAGWWMKGFGYYGNQIGQGSFTGYNAAIFGTMIAYDAPISPGLRAGAGVGYAHSSILGNVFAATSNISTFQVTGYMAYEPSQWFVYGDVSFGLNSYTGSRQIAFPGFNRTANASYGGQSYTGFLSTGYHFFTQGFTLTPVASLQYTHMNLNAYAETGAGDINLNIAAQQYDFLESGLGMKVARPFGAGNKVYVPEAHFKWLYELNNPLLQNTASFVAGSPAFTTPGYQVSPSTFNVGGGVTLLSCQCSARTWSVEAVYDFDWRTDGYTAHQGMLRVSGRF